MRVRRLPPDIQIFYCARPDQEPFVKVCWRPDSLSGGLGPSALCHSDVLKCFLIRKDQAAFSARADLLFTLERDTNVVCPFPLESKFHTLFFHSAAPFCTCAKCRGPPKHVLYLTHLKCWICDSLTVCSLSKCPLENDKNLRANKSGSGDSILETE